MACCWAPRSGAGVGGGGGDGGSALVAFPGGPDCRAGDVVGVPPVPADERAVVRLVVALAALASLARQELLSSYRHRNLGKGRKYLA